MKKNVIMLEIEEKLKNDSSGNYRRELSEELNQHKGNLINLIQTGDLSPEKFQALEKLKLAIDEALKIIK